MNKKQIAGFVVGIFFAFLAHRAAGHAHEWIREFLQVWVVYLLAFLSCVFYMVYGDTYLDGVPADGKDTYLKGELHGDYAPPPASGAQDD